MEDGFKVPIFPAKPPKVEEALGEPEIPYKIPKWNGSKPESEYSFEVLKAGAIVEQVKDLQERSFWMIGRLPIGSGVNITAAHPTVSRFHAVLQYKDSSSDAETENGIPSGWFIFDLDSTHGTFLNKMRIKPRTYVRVKVGYQLKLGNSTRNYLLQGPSEDEDDESEFSITELKEQKVQREAEMRQKLIDDKLEQERKIKEKEEAGISWGMAEDAEEEPDLSENPFAQTNNEELFLDDPKKTLRGFFEREGYDLEYKCDELSPGVFYCRVELPTIDDEYGKPITCEVQHKGKKKECVVQCALEACRILDRHGVLRQANQESRRSKKVTNDDNSDDDNFFDRTGDVEKKRLKRIGTAPSEAFTYEQLMEQEKEIVEKIETNDKKLQQMVEVERRQRMQNDEDLDDYMNNLSSLDQKVDKFAISSIKMEIQNMKIEHQKIKKLINIARPSVSLPPIAAVGKGKLPLFGKRNSLGRNLAVKKTEPVEVPQKMEESSENIEADVEEEGEEASVKAPETLETMQDVIVKETAQSIPEIFEVQPCKTEIESSRKDELKSPLKVKEPDEPVEKKQKLEGVSVVETVKEAATFSSSTSTQESSSKKKKTRIRIRNRLRENVDINDDDEYIDEEKVSTWVAPDNQTGDGTTHLNDKFGY